jgi:DNA-binding LytR/AlgR family response regulator
MIKCILVDDEPLARSLVEGHIAAVPFLELSGSFKNAILAADFLAKNQVDLIFLDIQMPMLTGIQFLKTLSRPPKVIFTTAYREYAVESYELEVVDYLLKPITFERFFKAVSKLAIPTQTVAPTATVQATPEAIFVQSNKKHIKVVLDDILYIESLKDYLKIHRKEGVLVIKERISQFALGLPSDRFLQVHRSYIVRIAAVTAFTQLDIEIGDREIPIGGKYKEAILKVLKK